MAYKKFDLILPKKSLAIFLVILMIIVPFTSVSSQTQMEDVVYLKNGSIIRGQIIEQVPNVSVKIQTKDGSVFVYEMEEILKITKEPIKTTESVKREEKTNGYLEGRLAGERDAKGNPLWIIAGLTGTYFCLLIGCLGVTVAYFIKPSPPSEKLIGKSPEYVLGYTEAYQNKARRENTMWAALGCATAALINLLIAIATTPVEQKF